MRLIDAETLETSLANLRGVWTSWNNWKRIRAIIEDMPTVDPMKHAHWISNKDTFDTCRCSQCGCSHSLNIRIVVTVERR